MFTRLGRLIARRPLLIILAWGLAVAGGVIWAVQAEEAPPGNIDSFLPPDAPHNRALALIRQAFPQVAARSQIVVIAHRPTGLTADDFAWLGRTAEAAGKAVRQQHGAKQGQGPAAQPPVLSPTVGFLKPRLVSPDEQAAMIVVSLSSNFVSPATQAAVERVEAVATAHPPAGLTVEITGTAGIGRDYAIHTARALDKTTWVTVIAVLTILVLVYRSPIGAVVPLVSIGASVFLAFIMLALLARGGWNISDMERIFAVVLIFGAGVDYALFWIARYREGLRSDLDFAGCAAAATRQAGPSILASAATTICGLSCMVATDLIPTQNVGKVLAAVLGVALLAALTLAPALARLLGPLLFWPVGPRGKPSIGQRVIWPALADRVTRRPGLCLLLGTGLLGGLALRSLTLDPRFDALSELPPGSSSERGYEIAREHFSKGQLYSANLLLHFHQPLGTMSDVQAISRVVTDRVAKLEGVHDVYALDAPLGRSRTNAKRDAGELFSSLTKELYSSFTRAFYLSQSSQVLRFEILIDYLPFSPEAMAVVGRVERIANEVAADQARAGREADVLLAGPTPYVISVRAVAGSDLRRVMLLATAVIALIVLLLVRDLPLTLFMVLATWLTYGATLCLSDLFFVHVMGGQGLDWKVRLIVFVIVVAVGQDYNIFLVTRLLQEPAQVNDAEAARRAIVSTGAVISSCGIIMAATLGSLWAGELLLLRQAGFTLALGILIDTFLVRPLLIPSFFLATRRRRNRVGVKITADA